MANECKAVQIAPAAQAWLDIFSNGRPLHIFPHACNLVNDQGAVLSLVTSDIGPNPLAIVLPPLHFPDFITMGATPTLTLPLEGGGDTSSSRLREIAGVRVSVGQLTIDLTTAVSWNPTPSWHNPLDLDLIQSIVTNHPDFETAVPLHLASQMQQALHNHDRVLIARTARQLAGLGPGLTPAGDDFLVGVLYSLFSNHYSVIGNPSSNYGSLLTDYCSLITAAAVPHTTTLSANLLQAAGRGEASQVWHDLMSAHTSDFFKKSDVYYKAITSILRTGHSSGSDAMLGFLLALNWSEQK